jgi:hypothetical protein
MFDLKVNNLAGVIDQAIGSRLFRAPLKERDSVKIRFYTKTLPKGMKVDPLEDTSNLPPGTQFVRALRHTRPDDIYQALRNRGFLRYEVKSFDRGTGDNLKHLGFVVQFEMSQGKPREKDVLSDDILILLETNYGYVHGFRNSDNICLLYTAPVDHDMIHGLITVIENEIVATVL